MIESISKSYGPFFYGHSNCTGEPFLERSISVLFYVAANLLCLFGMIGFCLASGVVVVLIPCLLRRFLNLESKTRDKFESVLVLTDLIRAL